MSPSAAKTAAPTAGEVRLRTFYSGVSAGTELSAYRGRRLRGQAVIQFVIGGRVALFVLGSLLVLRELRRREAIEDAREFSERVGHGIVESNRSAAVLRQDRAAIARLDRVVQERVLGGP
jgi:hypothetical protein